MLTLEIPKGFLTSIVKDGRIKKKFRRNFKDLHEVEVRTPKESYVNVRNTEGISNVYCKRWKKKKEIPKEFQGLTRSGSPNSEGVIC